MPAVIHNRQYFRLNLNGEIMLTSVSAFSDGYFSVDGLDGEEYITLDKIRELFSEDVLCVKPSDNETVSFGALGKARCKTVYDVLKEEKIKEIENELLRLQNKPDALETARQAYLNYLMLPTEQNKEKLRFAYKAVPEHQRMYLGDMDTRDRDYIRILYTDDKREV